MRRTSYKCLALNVDRGHRSPGGDVKNDVLKWKCGLITNPCHLMTEVLFWNMSLTLDVTTQYHNIDKEKKIFISFLGIEMVIYLQKLESSSSKDTSSQVWLKLAMGFWKLRFLDSVNVFLLFQYYLPLEKGVALHSKINLSLLHWKIIFCQSWLKLAQWFWRRRNFFNFVNVFSIFHHLPSEKVVAFHLHKVESPSGLPPSMHFQSLEKMKM